MKKLLLSLFAVLTASFAMGQTVTLDFTTNDWGFPDKANMGVEETTFTNSNDVAIALTGSTGAGYYFNTDGYLMLGKSGASLSLPAFDFDTEKIIVYGKAGASAATISNIYVGDDAVSTEAKGSQTSNTFEIAEAYQAAGSVYTLKITSKHNLQITKIEVYKVGEEVDPTPAGDNFEAALTDAQGNWTFEDVVIPEDLSYIWSQSSTYGMKASAFANNTKYVTDSYLVSPAIVLQENSVLTFDHAWRFGAEDIATQLTLWVREANATEKTQVTIPNYSDGTSWSYVSSGEIDLSAYAGKTIQLCFRYTSNEDYAATWEIKNVKVTNAKAAEEGPVLKDPTNTPETAYSVAEAINIISNKDGYDMSKKVYTKGVITSIKSIDVSQYVRAQYYIGETVDAETTLYVYNGYYLNGQDFTDNEQIKVGDEVIVYGMLTLYNTTPEIDQNNYIYSLNGETPVQSISADVRKEQVIFDLSGRRVEKAVKGVYIVNGKKVVF
ncbi:MAG: choice-of-anchor J domain-containing protein [Bacteroidaceae bacterium]|nr:choice-of-anchor J domain-containing protein [Bacteroidaceae bacterium]